MNNYIDKVLKHIKDKDKNTIKLELENLVEEKEAFYSSIGYDDATAFDKACENLGDTPEIVGEQLSSIHSSNKWIYFVIYLFNILAICNCFFIKIFDLYHTVYSLFSLFIFVFFNLICIITTIRLKKFSALLTNFIFYIINMILSLKTILFSSLFLCLGVQGRMNDFFKLMFYNDFDTKPLLTGIIVTVSALLIVVQLFFYIWGLILNYKFEKCKFRKKDLKRETFLNVICICFAVLLIFANVLLCVRYKSFIRERSSVKIIDDIYLVQSDSYQENYEEMEIKINTGTYYSNISYGMDFGSPDIEPYGVDSEDFEDLNVVTVYSDDYFDDIEIKTNIISATYKVNSRYVYIVPRVFYKDRFKADMSNVVVIDTQSQKSFKSSYYTNIDNNGIFYEITFVDDTDQ